MIRLCAAIVLLLSTVSCASTGTGNTNDPPPAPPAAGNPGSGEGDAVQRGKMYAERELREAELAAEDEYEEQSGRNPELTEAQQQRLREQSERFLRDLCRQIYAEPGTYSYDSVPESCRKWVGR